MAVTLRDDMVAPVMALMPFGEMSPAFLHHQWFAGFLTGELIPPVCKDDLISQPRCLFLLQNEKPGNGFHSWIKTEEQFNFVGIPLTAGFNHPSGQLTVKGYPKEGINFYLVARGDFQVSGGNLHGILLGPPCDRRPRRPTPVREPCPLFRSFYYRQ